MEDKKVTIVQSVDEAKYYPSAENQFESNRKFMTYDSISTGVGGKK